MDDNLFLDHVVHYGNDPTPDGNSDCISWGDWNGSNDCRLGYIRNCELYHGADEVMAFTPRMNDAAIGRTVADVTLEKTIIANPSGINDHALLYFIGDGVTRITNFHVLMATAHARFPFVRRYADNIEFINCAAYNFNENAAQIMPQAGIDFRGCLYRLGPRWNNIRAPFSLEPSTNAYLDDILTDSKIGKVNSWGFARGDSARATSQINQSGLVPRPAGTVADEIAAHCGAWLYEGRRDSTTLDVLDGFYYGCGPQGLLPGYGPQRAVTGSSYPISNSLGVPLSYLTSYPSDTNPEAIIADGSAWNGYMVAERIGAWLVSAKNGTAVTAAPARRVHAMDLPATYSLDGRRLTGKLQSPGVYVRMNQKLPSGFIFCQWHQEVKGR
jgi:hypothetical protein